ncbi:YoaK family protein [Streptomyces sasae]|uniref:YoaK family protein n=1 Tax=Streptomyces sasae TaxID=1266772 RepID=UPI0029305D8F|nr:YoaK family protein [Streptomyces sasae]
MPTGTPTRDPETRGLRLVPVLLVLTMVSGLIDAVGYLGLGHVFTANMTGNVVILGFAAAGSPDFSVPHSATSLAAFMLGAAVGGRMAARFGGGSRRRWMRVTLATEAVLVATSAVVAFAGSGAPATTYTLIALTAFAMGLRNANVRKLGVPDLTATTVLTTTLTGLVSESRLGDGTSRRSPRRAGAITSLFAGAVLGAWLVRHHSPGVPLLVAAAVSGVLAVIASGRE